MAATNIQNRIAMMAGGLPGMAYMHGGWMAAGVWSVGATMTATKAAPSPTTATHWLTAFDVSVDDASLVADTYVKVELIEDVAGTPATIATFKLAWDIDETGMMLTPHITYSLPQPVKCTAGKSVSAKVTVALNPDAGSVNLYGFTK